MTNPTDSSPNAIAMKQPFEKFEKLTHWLRQLALADKTISCHDWNDFLAELNGVCELAFRHLHPSPSGWIDVKDRVPEYTECYEMWNDETGKREPYGKPMFQTVLAYNEELGVFKATYSKHDHWSEISSCSINGTVKPTHWQPLPPIPGDK
jgi:Protein of unknown function (DUF551)